ncbi:hypothetical protein D0T84_20030 [Dysgonomonas sp. 521]|nr:hypothetical protein [Dysgonomonas sp. 521]
MYCAKVVIHIFNCNLYEVIQTFILLSFCHADDRNHLISQEIFHFVQNDKESIHFKIFPKVKSLDDFYVKELYIR